MSSMEMKLLPWIEDDIAIEIIGKMIAEQMRQVYKLIDEHKANGYAFDSEEVMNDGHYQQLLTRVREYRAEIKQIYRGKELEDLYRKVDEVYAPHLKKQYIARKEQIKFFNETEGFGFIESGDNEKNMFVSASDLTNRIDEDKRITPESTTWVNRNS